METRSIPVDKTVMGKCPSKKRRDLRRSYTFIQNKVKTEVDLLRKENQNQNVKINDLKVKLKERDELVQLKDGKMASMEFENNNLKYKLKQYSIYLKNAVAQNDKFNESIKDKNNEIVKLKTDKNYLKNALEIAQNNIRKLEIDFYLKKENDGYK